MLKKYSIFYFLISSLFLLSCSKERILSNLEHDLHVIKLEIKDEYLWSADSGMYIVGSNGIQLGHCGGKANYNQSWEYPAYFSLFDGEQELIERQQIGLKIKGNCTRSNAMKSLGIYWRKEYGNKNIDYPFFPDNTTDKYKRLFLRNSGNDFGQTHLKDAAITQIIKDFTAADVQNYKPSVVYLNNEYWGIHNMRDMVTPHHFDYQYGAEKNYVDILEGNEEAPLIDDGSSDLFLSEVVDFVKNNDMSNDANLAIIENRINLESYMDYIITQTYIVNGDQLHNNVKWWRDQTSLTHNKWTWIIYDTDLSFSKNDVEELWIGSLVGDYKSGFFLFNHLLKNEKFKKDFLTRYLYFIEHVFEPKRVETIINDLAGNIESEYENHQLKWNLPSSYSWKNKVNDLIEFNTKRNEFMHEQISNLMQNVR